MNRIGLVIIGLTAAVGASAAVAAWISSSAADCGRRLLPSALDSYRRPYGPYASWNIPVESLARDPASDELVGLLWHDAPASRPGNFNLTFEEYTYPVYSARCATDSYTVVTEWPTALNGQSIPWNPKWKPAFGTDGQAIVIDPATGREWNLWRAEFDGTKVRATNGSLLPGNYQDYQGGNYPSRGIGIQYLAMLVRPEEVARGKIEHALSMPIRNPDGTRFVPPATKLEYPGRSPGIPLGTRFGLDVTDDEIEHWIAGLPPELPEATRRSAKIIAVALRDYGWFVTDTSGAAHFQFEDRASAGAEWDALSLGRVEIADKEYPRDLLDGLMSQKRIYAILPPGRAK
jgi:hypothetical protein